MEKPSPDVADLIAQNTALTVQLENVTAESSDLRKRCDQAEGTLTSVQSQLETLKRQRQDEAAESPSKLKMQIQSLVTRNNDLVKKINSAAAPEKIRELVKARVDLQSNAQVVLGHEVRVDELDDRALRVRVIDQLYGAGKDRDESGQPRSDEYIKAMFDTAVSNYRQGSEAISRVREIVTSVPDQRTDSRSARERMVHTNQNRWNHQEAK